MQVRVKCVQSVTSVCQHADRSVSTALIHAVATPILEHVIRCAESEDNKPSDELEFNVVVEAMKLAEVLVSIADHNRVFSLLLTRSLKVYHWVQCLRSDVVSYFVQSSSII